MYLPIEISCGVLLQNILYIYICIFVKCQSILKYLVCTSGKLHSVRQPIGIMYPYVDFDATCT